VIIVFCNKKKKVCLTYKLAHIKIIKNRNYLLKNTNYLLKNNLFNKNVQIFIQTYYFKLFNMCKFVHDRKK
jgi:hypothetical protein